MLSMNFFSAKALSLILAQNKESVERRTPGKRNINEIAMRKHICIAGVYVLTTSDTLMVLLKIGKGSFKPLLNTKA